MLWARMPALDPAEWLELLPELDLSAARVAPDEVARTLAVTPTRLEIAMLGDRPVYRFAADGRSATVFADDGARLHALGDDEVMRLARALFPEHAATARQDRRLESPDQWTLQNRDALPLHRIMLGDDEDTWVYLSERTGELVMAATRSERRRAYASAIPHWLYVTPLRRHGVLWGRLVIALSLAGCRARRVRGLLWRSLAAATRSRTIGKHRTRFALRRPHALAPLRGPGIRPLHLHLGGERLPVDGSLELALLHRSHHRAGSRGRRRADVDRDAHARSVARGAGVARGPAPTGCASQLAGEGEDARAGAVPVRALSGRLPRAR